MTQNTTIRVWRCRMRPTPEQVRVMDRTLETLRGLYNEALAQRTCAYQEDKTSVTLGEQKKWLTTLRQCRPELAAVNCGNAQQALMTLDLAFQSFFRRVKQGETPGYPKPKRPHEYNTVKYNRIGNGCKWHQDKHQIYLQHVGMVRLIGWTKHPVPSDAEVRTAHWTRQADGYFLLLTLRVPGVTVAPSQKPAVGIALNVFPMFTQSDGRIVRPALPFEKSLAEIRRRQARLVWKANAARLSEQERTRPRVFDKYPARDEEMPETRNLQKRREEFARLHRHIQDQRREWHILTARSLVQAHGKIVIEGYPIKKIIEMEKGIGECTTNRRIHDNAWAQFIQTLQQQAPKFGAEIILIPPISPQSYRTQEERARQVLEAGLQSSGG